MKINVIINTKTRLVELESRFRDRLKATTSFNGPLNKVLVTQLDPDCIMQELIATPVHDERFQTFYLSDPFLVNGVLTVKWIVKAKDKNDTSRYLNSLVEEWIDSKAVEKGYSNQDRMIGYIGDPNAQSDREGRYMRFWRSQVWDVVLPRITATLESLDSEDFKPVGLTDLIKGIPPFEIPNNF